MTQERIFPAVRRIVIWLGLVYLAWMWIDLALHPLAAGSNEAGPLFRWLSALIGSATILTALFIIRKVPDNLIGLLLFLWGFGIACYSTRTEWADMRFGIPANLFFFIVVYEISLPSLVLLLFYFPDGKLYPVRLERWMPAIFALLVVAGSFYILSFRPPQGSPVQVPNLLFVPAFEKIGFGIFLAGMVTGLSFALFTLVLRYRDGGERLRSQLKWMAWLLGVVILLAVVPYDRFAGPYLGQARLFSQTGFLIFQELFPALGIGMAVLRHNLWDIDLIIRRTLVYTVLTGLLASIYYTSVLLMQAVVGRFSSERSPLLVVLSTLLVAALFSPLRRRVQNFIDRRFFRQKYDAEKALAVFAAAARSETNPEALTSSLVSTVDQTMRPIHVNLWLSQAHKVQPK